MKYIIHGSKNQNDSKLFFNLLQSEFDETNERRFDPLLRALITHWLSITGNQEEIKYYLCYYYQFVIKAGRNVAYSFRQTRSKVSLNFTIIFKVMF